MGVTLQELNSDVKLRFVSVLVLVHVPLVLGLRALIFNETEEILHASVGLVEEVKLLIRVLHAQPVRHQRHIHLVGPPCFTAYRFILLSECGII